MCNYEFFLFSVRKKRSTEVFVSSARGCFRIVGTSRSFLWFGSEIVANRFNRGSYVFDVREINAIGVSVYECASSLICSFLTEKTCNYRKYIFC